MLRSLVGRPASRSDSGFPLRRIAPGFQL
jgi:hypothetical protein